MSVNAVQVSEDAGVSDQYSGESDKALTEHSHASVGMR